MLARATCAAASAAFTRAFNQSTGHPKASVGAYAIAIQGGDEDAIDRARSATDAAIEELQRGERHVEAALVAAGAQLARSEVAGALETLDRLLNSAPAGPAGWIIPIDPMLAGIHEHPGKPGLFAKLAARAA